MYFLNLEGKGLTSQQCQSFTYPVHEILLLQLDHVGLGAVPAAVERRLLLNELVQDEQQQLVVVALVRQVLRERLPHVPRHGELLRVDEALQHHPDRHVDVVFGHVLSQVHLGMRLGHADHRLDMANGDRYRASGLRTRR